MWVWLSTHKDAYKEIFARKRNRLTRYLILTPPLEVEIFNMKKSPVCVYSIRTIVSIIVISHSKNYGESGTSEELWDRLGGRIKLARQ